MLIVLTALFSESKTLSYFTCGILRIRSLYSCIPILIIFKAYEEAYFGQLPPDVGGTLLNLGMAYYRIHDAGKAEPLYLR